MLLRFITIFIIGPANAGTAEIALPEDKENMVRRDNMGVSKAFLKFSLINFQSFTSELLYFCLV